MVKNGVPADRAHYIPTFPVITPLPPLDRTTLNTPPGAKALLTLSRLHEKKGLDTFLHAVRDLPGCVAWLAGDGPLQLSWKTGSRFGDCRAGSLLDGAPTARHFCGPRTFVCCPQDMSLSAQ